MNHKPKCPHCDYEFTDDETFYSEQDVSFIDGDMTDLNCPGCGEEFHVLCIHHYEFQNVDEDGDDLPNDKVSGR